MPERELSYVEFRAERAAKEAEWTQRDEVKAAIDFGASALSGANSRDVSDIQRLIDDVLLPALLPHGRVEHYHAAIGSHEDWSFSAIVDALDNSLDTRREVVRAFRALVAIAEHEDIVGDVRNYATAFGYERRLGRLWSPYEMDVGDEVQIVTRNSGHPKTLFCGSTGQGKSATLDAEVADRFAAGYKVIDLVDTDEFENAVYDIPQRQPTLREVRQEFGLPVDTDAADYDAPDLEVLVPLTAETAAMDIPTREDGSSPLRAFSIPSASLDETTLVSLLTALVSQQQEASVRTAYDKVDESGDWTLDDLATQIAERDDLQDSFQRRLLRLLENLQDKGFIRDQTCPHAIDWERIFRDQETVTAFSVAPLESEVDQLMVLSYLIHALYHRRKQFGELPPAAGVMRELHEIVPHRNETVADRRSEALQKAIASNLSYILRKNRHERLEILADTQDVMDLKKGVRKRFSRYVAFKMPDGSLQSLFDYAGETGWQSCRDAISGDAGEGAVVGMTRPNITRDLSFLAPIQFAPGPFHHFDVDEHDTGLETRVDYLDEEFAPAPWSGTVPERLQFAAEEVDANGSPLVAFRNECLNVGEHATARTDAVLRAYNTFAEERGYDTIGGKQWLSRRLRSEAQLEFTTEAGEYEGFELSSDGEHYLGPTADGTEPASADD